MSLGRAGRESRCASRATRRVTRSTVPGRPGFEFQTTLRWVPPGARLQVRCGNQPPSEPVNGADRQNGVWRRPATQPGQPGTLADWPEPIDQAGDLPHGE